MKLIWLKTNEISLDEFLNFCIKRQNIKDKYQYKNIKNLYSLLFDSNSHIILNDKGEYLGGLEHIKERVCSGNAIWSIDDIDLINVYEEEYFDFDGYERFVNDPKYKIVKIGFNRKKEWIYLEIENNYTHYRNYIINFECFINIKKYIRQSKINSLLKDI